MFRKITYTNLGGYKPYIQTAFCNRLTQKLESTMALIDSGADSILIPHTLGLRIGLVRPLPDELKIVAGIGGVLPYVERECEIGIENEEMNKLYLFKHNIHWIYPNPDDEKRINKYLDDIQEIEKILPTQKNPAQIAYLKKMLKEEKEQLSNLLNIYETTTLLGRTFFTNFEFINFCQRDNEKNCRFNYKIFKPRIAQTIEIAINHRVSKSEVVKV